MSKCATSLAAFEVWGLPVQAWQVPHPPSAGNSARAACASRPAVHQGFWKSWAANNLNERMVARVLDIISSNNWSFTKVRRQSTRLSEQSCPDQV